MIQPQLLPDTFGIKNYNKLNPIIKWAGGKNHELKHILPNLPQKCDRYIEPFVGGGAVFFAVNRDEMLINDKSKELTSIYQLVKKNNSEFFNLLNQINQRWRLIEEFITNKSSELCSIYRRYSTDELSDQNLKRNISDFVHHESKTIKTIVKPPFALDQSVYLMENEKNLLNKLIRMKRIEKENGEFSKKNILDNLETAFKSAFYMYLRDIYNKTEAYQVSNSFASAVFYFVREYCYASMFRYNLDGEFNVPYGGMQYNRKNFIKKIRTLQANEYLKHLKKAKIYNLDFEKFLDRVSPKHDDFIFLDPPYDSNFSTYAQNVFNSDDHVRLANYLKEKCKAQFMLVIKNTEFIAKLYFGNGFNTKVFDKRYLVSFQDRNDKNAEHLLITNYPSKD